MGNGMRRPRLATAIGLTMGVFVIASTQAAERADYDRDDDGLIEIEDLVDLNEIRNNATGDTVPTILGDRLYGSSTGCPQSGCLGYELVNDLNFDVNRDGSVGEQDPYWNNGKGWDPIGSFSVKFAAELNGNGHVIRNLTMNRPGEPFMGLIAYAERAYVHDLVLDADLIVGQESGALAGYAWQSRFDGIDARVAVTGQPGTDDCSGKCGNDTVGGLVGLIDDNTVIRDSRVETRVQGGEGIGGLVGRLIDSQISDSAVKAWVRAERVAGGAVGTAGGAEIERLAIAADIKADHYIGGMVAVAARNSRIQDGLVTGRVNLTGATEQYARYSGVVGYAGEGATQGVITLVRAPEDADDQHFNGAIVGQRKNRHTLANNYWAIDLAHQTLAYETSSSSPGSGTFNLIDLQCATAEKERCNGLRFYEFDSKTNADGAPLWQFGTNTEAPGMQLSVGLFADRDGDGAFDNWPTLIEPLPEPEPEPEPQPEPDPGSDTGANGGAFGLVLFLTLGLVVGGRRLRLSSNLG